MREGGAEVGKERWGKLELFGCGPSCAGVLSVTAVQEAAGAECAGFPDKLWIVVAEARATEERRQPRRQAAHLGGHGI